MKSHHLRIPRSRLKIQVAYGNRLAASMQKRGITAGSLQCTTGISRSHIYKIMRGKRAPSREIARKFKKLFGIEWQCPVCGQFYASEEALQGAAEYYQEKGRDGK